MAASFEPMLENGSSADVVAKVVLNAVTSENPSLMYLAGTYSNSRVRSARLRTHSDHSLIRPVL